MGKEGCMSFRSPKLLQSAEGQPCANCGKNDGTTVAAHLNSVAFGKGVGVKCPDSLVADLCDVCHACYDGRLGNFSKQEKWELWVRAYLKTVVRWFEQEVIIIK